METFSTIIFKLKSELSEERITVLNSFFTKEKSKNLSIKRNEKILVKLHEVILEEDFEGVLSMFQNNILLLPDNFNANLMDQIIKYLYFRKFEEVQLGSIFELLELSIFFKLTDLSEEIVDFLRINLNSEKLVFHIGDLACKSVRASGTNEWIVIILGICKIFLLKNSLLNAYLLFIQQTFFFENEVQSNNFDSIFSSNLQLITDSVSSEEYKLKLAIFMKINMQETLKKFCPI